MDTPATLAPPTHTVDVRWELVQKVAGSASFQRSPRLRELLIYICERAILNRPEELREQQIGCGVFGRRQDYSPGEDNIVRVEIRHLRKRLEEYFAGEGKDEPTVIVVPKGAYVPVFEAREIIPPPAPPATVIPSPVETLPAQSAPWWFYAPVAGAAILLCLCFGLWQENRNIARTLAAMPAVEPPASPLWPMLFNQEHQTYIVCADSTLVVAETLLRRKISLEEYLTGDYSTLRGSLTPETATIIHRLPRWQFSDMADVRLVQRLSRINARHWDKVTIRSARTTQIQDFKNGNIVLLGSIRSNPWNQLFEPALNFQFDFDEEYKTPVIRNKAPLSGEQAVYRSATPGQSGEAYSTITFVPNLRHTGNVLIVAGTTAESTEATGEFLTNPGTAAELNSLLTQRAKNRAPYFEVLLKSVSLAGIARNPEVIAVRILPGETAPN
jgi:hypothetical protein